MIDRIKKELDSRCPNHISIVAGHYCVSKELMELGSDQIIEESTFCLGVEIYKYISDHGYDCSLILFVNDIGISLGERKILKRNPTIPKNYRAILDKYNKKPSDVDIWFESMLRNKASKLISKENKNNKIIIKDSGDEGLVRCINNAECSVPESNKIAMTIVGPEGDKLVVKEGTNPKCNSILATMYKQLQDNKKSDFNINIFNSIYSYRILLGKYVYKKLFDGTIDHMDIFIDERGIIQ